METLANVEIERKNFDHARQLLMQVLEARKASRGPRALSGVYTNLGVLEARRGNLQGALEWLQAAYDVSLSNGKQNLHALFNIAGLHFNLGRARLAAKTFEQCFEVYQRRHKQSRDVADSLAFHGISWIHAGELEKGRTFLMRGIEMGRTQGSPTHSVNLTYAAQLALVDHDRPRARALLEEATKPSIASPSLFELVKAQLAREDTGCATARPLLAKALEKAIADSERWVQTMATIELASCELEAGADAAAKSRLEAELAWLVKVGADDTIRARVQAVLARAK
jgi:tetratricopeptide (TPR) repeat protein